ncbi:MAG: TetR/AcrR family transcriptional regulator [Parvibaculum sp.]|nr:TetR/AcrR family transcriptional regulator [Parvibaculum sp.]
MAAEGGRRRGRPRDNEADKAILDAALGLFIERGAAGTSLEEVARRAGVARTTLYRRWASREALLADAIAQIRIGAEEQAGEWRDLPLAGVLQQAVDIVPRLVSQPFARPLVTQLLAAPALFEIYLKTQLGPRQAEFRKLLARAKREGELPSDTDLAALEALIAGVFLNLLLMRTEAPGEAEARAYLRRSFRALGLLAAK